MQTPSASPPVQTALRACRSHLIAACLFSLITNLLYFTPSIFMLQVYDRVLSSGSEATLVLLTGITVLGLLTLVALEDIRGRILVRLGLRLDSRLAPLVLAAQVERQGQGAPGPRQAPLRDLDAFRSFITGPGIHAILDALWMPVYLIGVFLLDFHLGSVALIGALLLLVLAVANEFATVRLLQRATDVAVRNYGGTESAVRHAEVIQAMGMLGAMMRRWTDERDRVLGNQAVASERAAFFSAAIRFVSLGLQTAMLAIGAYLVIERSISPGVMFAAMLLAGRALAPVERLVNTWRQVVNARSALATVNQLLRETPQRPVSMRLPTPEGRLVVDRVFYTAAGPEPRQILKNINFQLEPGESLAVIGPSASGKSTLARLIVGVWKPTLGVVRLDGADVFAWDRADFGRHVGYLPQEIDLFAGTVRENIARLDEGDPDLVVEAAVKAGVHQMILDLPRGYETQIGESGTILSGGQRQRLGLARALYGRPRLLLLDEPNSNLDGDGEEALRRMLGVARAEGITAIVIAHRPSVVSVVDKVLVLRNGTVDMFGPRQEILARLTPGGALRPVPNEPQTSRNVIGSLK